MKYIFILTTLLLCGCSSTLTHEEPKDECNYQDLYRGINVCDVGD